MKPERLLKHIPNLFTLGNLLFGCLGIIFCFSDNIFPVELRELNESGTSLSVIFGFNNRLYLASFMIFGATIFDFLDGFVARMLHVQSPIGKELDSLADMVTFGVLPGCVFYQLLSGAYHLTPGALNVPMINLLPAFLIALCSALRLAKFNIDERQHVGFIGLATPATALFAASLPMIIFTGAYNLGSVILNQWVLYALIIFFSWLMVSNIKMFSLKTKSFQWKGNELRILFLIASIVLIALLQYTGIAAAILLYIIINITNHFFHNSEEELPETSSINP